MAANESGAVVVTGASTGIGRAMALLLDAEGYRVFAGVRKEADGRELSQAASDQLTPVMIDVTDAEQIEAASRQVAEAVGDEGLVGLVNNAGVGGGGPIEFMPLDELRSTLEVNLIGQVAVTQAFIPLIRKAEGNDRLHRLDRRPRREPLHVAVQHLEVRARGARRVAAPRAAALGASMWRSSSRARSTPRSGPRATTRPASSSTRCRRTPDASTAASSPASCEVISETASRGIPAREGRRGGP